MLWAITVILILLWALGLVTSFTLGGYLHVLLGVAVLLLLFRAAGLMKSHPQGGA